MKPVAAGLDAQGRNEDVERLLAASSIQPARSLVNPYGFGAAIAPHIAAAEEGRRIELPRIAASEHAADPRRRGSRRRGRRFPCAARRHPATPPIWRRCSLAGDSRRRHAPRVHQPCAADPAGDRRLRPAAGRLGGQPHRSGDVTFQRKPGGPAGNGCRRRCSASSSMARRPNTRPWRYAFPIGRKVAGRPPDGSRQAPVHSCPGEAT
jgi:hypothetical protein